MKKKSFYKIHWSDADEEDTTEYPTYRRRSIRRKNVRRRWAKDYKDNHLINMISFLSPHYQFARSLAESMDDLKSLPQYLKWVEQFPRDVLEEVRAKVLSRKDIQNKGAYFTVALKHHEHNQKRDSRD